MTDEPLEMNYVHFLVAPRIEKSRDFSAHVVHVLALLYGPSNIREYSDDVLGAVIQLAQFRD